jgi:hypothetical protein
LAYSAFDADAELAADTAIRRSLQTVGFSNVHELDIAFTPSDAVLSAAERHVVATVTFRDPDEVEAFKANVVQIEAIVNQTLTTTTAPTLPTLLDVSLSFPSVNLAAAVNGYVLLLDAVQFALKSYNMTTDVSSSFRVSYSGDAGTVAQFALQSAKEVSHFQSVTASVQFTAVGHYNAALAAALTAAEQANEEPSTSGNSGSANNDESTAVVTVALVIVGVMIFILVVVAIVVLRFNRERNVAPTLPAEVDHLPPSIYPAPPRAAWPNPAYDLVFPSAVDDSGQSPRSAAPYTEFNEAESLLNIRSKADETVHEAFDALLNSSV